LQDIFSGLEAVPSPIEHLLADYLLLLVVQAVEEGMGEALLNGITLVWIEGEHFGEEVGCSGLDIREQLFPGLPRPLRQRFYVLNRIIVS
jgi:hypothetical protein